MKIKLLVNCGNLHNGGGVAVATSFIDCLARIDHDGIEISLLLSSSVLKNLVELGSDLTCFSSCIKHDFFGVSALWSSMDSYFYGYDIVFTVFGPAYFLRKRTLHLFGFAQPNIIYPTSPADNNLSLLEVFEKKIKFKIQALFFSRADVLVVELEHVREALSAQTFLRKKPVYVVNSAVHSIFKTQENWSSLNLVLHSDRLKLGVISRNYAHKNLGVLREVKNLLQKHYQRDIDFYVTFTPEEWRDCDSKFQSEIINVGGLSLSQCPSFYSAMDGVIFPSLLECFSAVPIEAMMMKRPLFASDLPFMRDVCSDYCNYFDPTNAADIALAIHEYFSLDELEKEMFCELAFSHVQKYTEPFDRAKNYLAVVKKTVENI